MLQRDPKLYAPTKHSLRVGPLGADKVIKITEWIENKQEITRYGDVGHKDIRAEIVGEYIYIHAKGMEKPGFFKCLTEAISQFFVCPVVTYHPSSLEEYVDNREVCLLCIKNDYLWYIVIGTEFVFRVYAKYFSESTILPHDHAKVFKYAIQKELDFVVKHGGESPISEWEESLGFEIPVNLLRPAPGLDRGEYLHVKTSTLYSVGEPAINCTNGQKNSSTVVYRNTDGELLTRDLEEFIEEVQIGDRKVPRFKKTEVPDHG